MQTLFRWHSAGGTETLPTLTPQDESTVSPGLFLVGPSVSQGSIGDPRAAQHQLKKRVVFDSIYKFRTRFPVVARAIAERLGGADLNALADYRAHGMYMDSVGHRSDDKAAHACGCC